MVTVQYTTLHFQSRMHAPACDRVDQSNFNLTRSPMCISHSFVSCMWKPKIRRSVADCARMACVIEHCHDPPRPHSKKNASQNTYTLDALLHVSIKQSMSPLASSSPAKSCIILEHETISDAERLEGTDLQPSLLLHNSKPCGPYTL
jgi:hypothetical protein